MMDMKISHDMVKRSARLAGQLKRYHSWPVLRGDTVAEHTWQVMRIYLQIFGPMSPDVSAAIMEHDAGEHWTGDLPFGSKDAVPGMRAGLKAREQEAVDTMFPNLPESYRRPLSRPMEARIKSCDLLEMWEAGRQEVLMGNRLAVPIVDNTLDAISAMLPRMDELDQHSVQEFMRKSAERFL